MNVELSDFSSVVGALLVLGGILKHAIPGFPRRCIPLVTWGLGLLAYLAISGGWSDPHAWVGGLVAAAAATGIHSAAKNTIETKFPLEQ